MQLTYRGNQYELNASTVSTIPGEAIGKYRGAVLLCQRCVVTPAYGLNLVYRGAHYRPVVAQFVSTLSTAV
ncbi:MAG: DUF4278 domain-containing protein [Leptolyngbyaceae cyanobacterium SL_7_1]|nr:DUF4278 domain-containing protein [Leptolyngbyaceae cyanobacterium SL_7_1]